MLGRVTCPGPWFAAAYHGACSDCGEDISPDDVIRADGDGGYLCEDCGQDDGYLCDC